MRRGGKISHFLCALVDEKALPPLSGGGTAADAGGSSAAVEQSGGGGAHTPSLGDAASGRSNGSQDASSAGSSCSGTLAGKRYAIVGGGSDEPVPRLRCSMTDEFSVQKHLLRLSILAFTKVGGGFKDDDLRALQYANERPRARALSMARGA